LPGKAVQARGDVRVARAQRDLKKIIDGIGTEAANTAQNTTTTPVDQAMLAGLKAEAIERGISETRAQELADSAARSEADYQKILGNIRRRAAVKPAETLPTAPAATPAPAPKISQEQVGRLLQDESIATAARSTNLRDLLSEMGGVTWSEDGLKTYRERTDQSSRSKHTRGGVVKREGRAASDVAAELARDYPDLGIATEQDLMDRVLDWDQLKGTRVTRKAPQEAPGTATEPEATTQPAPESAPLDDPQEAQKREQERKDEERRHRILQLESRAKAANDETELNAIRLELAEEIDSGNYGTAMSDAMGKIVERALDRRAGELQAPRPEEERGVVGASAAATPESRVDEALRLARASGIASPSFFQRQMGVGYAEAARLRDEVVRRDPSLRPAEAQGEVEQRTVEASAQAAPAESPRRLTDVLWGSFERGETEVDGTSFKVLQDAKEAKARGEIPDRAAFDRFYEDFALGRTTSEEDRAAARERIKKQLAEEEAEELGERDARTVEPAARREEPEDPNAEAPPRLPPNRAPEGS
jgi:hypothetical protein